MWTIQLAMSYISCRGYLGSTLLKGLQPKKLLDIPSLWETTLGDNSFSKTRHHWPYQGCTSVQRNAHLCDGWFFFSLAHSEALKSPYLGNFESIWIRCTEENYTYYGGIGRLWARLIASWPLWANWKFPYLGNIVKFGWLWNTQSKLWLSSLN